MLNNNTIANKKDANARAKYVGGVDDLYIIYIAVLNDSKAWNVGRPISAIGLVFFADEASFPRKRESIFVLYDYDFGFFFFLLFT